MAPQDVVGSDFRPEDLGPTVARGSTTARLVREWDALLAVALGGVLGAEARYGIALLLPHRAGDVAWSTLIINVTGCALIGVLMVVLLEASRPHRWVRPFLGVGVLGGYTTFSTFAMDTQELLLAGRPGAALGFVALSLVLGALAVWGATRSTRFALRGPITRVAAAGAP